MAPLFTFCTDWIDTKDYLLLATMKYKETFSFVFDLSAFVPLHAEQNPSSATVTF